MADASQAITSFLGGEISQFAQGRFDKPDYKTSLNVCLNAFPVEIGPWTRRPGTQYGSHTRKGAPGRTIKFDFQASAPVTMEFTDGFVRFRNGAVLITGNDTQVIVSVSAANPAVVQTTSAVTWATGDTLIFPGASTPLLENRQFTATKVDTTHFSLADALTGANIDGSTLAALVAGATVAKVQELATAYIGGAWSGIRPVQAETTDILLSPTVAPQALTVTTLPSTGVNPVFSVVAATFNDGPYLDPFTNGVQATPSATKGVISITLGFPLYDSGKAYAVGSFVTSSAINYVSLVDQNVGNTPVSSPSQWAATSAGAAINNGQGFLGTDVGRLVRLFSEPLAWAVGTTYASGAVVSYNPSGLPGATTYWSSLVGSNVGNVPGTDLTHWQIIASGAAIWTWGKITSLQNQISQTLSGAANIGDMTLFGGLAAAFDGIISQATVNCAAKQNSRSGAGALGFNAYVGRDFSAASNQKIQSAVVYPSTDGGIAGIYVSGGSGSGSVNSCTITLYGSASLPANATNGTVLGTVNVPLGPTFFFAGLSPVTIISSDQNTAWKYVWVTILAQGIAARSDSSTLNITVAELQLFNPPGTGSSTGVNVEILGPALLYTNPVLTWRLGVYSNTTGWPTCGIYNDGRLYLGGAVGNRFDGSYANGVVGGTLNFAPTDQFGAVSAANAIAYTFNSKGVNQITWMKPDLQGIKAGTLAGEWLIQAPTAGAISPLNITARQVTSHGAANVEPVDTEHTLVFAQRFAKKLLEYFPDVFSGKFSAPNLADKAQHLTRAGIVELAYTSAVTPIIWVRDALNSLFGITYKRDSLASSQPPTFYGWHRHTLGTGRVVESICAGPSIGGTLDALTMVTNDTSANSSNIRHVEVMTDTMDEDSALATSWFLDDAVNPTSIILNASSVTFNGLWHLNGKTVQVFAGGLDCGAIGDLAKLWVNTFTYALNQYALGSDLNIYQSLANNNIGNDPTTDGGVHWTLIGTGLDFVVSNGSITVPYGDGISAGAGNGLLTGTFVSGLPLSQIVIGCTYNSDGQIVRPQLPQETGARSGPAFTKVSRDHFFGAQLVNTLGIAFGTNFSSLIPARFTLDDESTALPALTMFSDVYTDIPNSTYSRNKERLCWRVARPFPATITAIGASKATQDQ